MASKQKLLELIFDTCAPTRISLWKDGQYRTSIEEGAALADDASKDKSARSNLIKAHLDGAPIAVVPTDGSTTRVIVFDIDDKEKTQAERPVPDESKGRRHYVVGLAAQIIGVAREQGVKGFSVLSGSGHGAHVWFLLKNPIPLSQVDTFTRALLKNASTDRELLRVKNDGGIFAEKDGERNFHNIEVYPKGSRLIALPFARKSEGLAEQYADDGTFEGLVTLDGLVEYEQSEWFKDAMELTTLPSKRGAGADVDWEGAFEAFLRGHAKEKGDLGDYDAWQHAMMVAAASFRDTERADWAKRLMIAASKEAPRWDARAFEKHWSDAVRTVRNITAGSFWHYANIGGYKGTRPGGAPIRDISYPDPAPDCVNPALDVAKAMGERGYQLDDIRHELNRLFLDDWDEGLLDDIWVNPVPPALDYDRHVAPMNKEWAQIISSGVEYKHLPTDGSRTEKAFRDQLAHRKVPQFGANGQPVRARQLEELWREDPHRRVYNGFTCADPATYRGSAYNAIRPLPIEPEEGDVSVALEHIHHLTQTSGAEAARALLDFSADMLQRPAATDCQIAVILAGGSGTGKGSYGQLMQAVLGERYLQVTSTELEKPWSRSFFGRSLIFGDEVSFAGKKSTLEALKSYISEPTRSFEEKYLPQFVGPNVNRYVLATNNLQATHLEQDDRRYLLIDADAQESQAYFKRLHDWIAQPRNAAAWLHYLLNLEVNRATITGHAPITTLKRSVQKMSDPLTEVLVEIVSDGVIRFDEEGEGGVATQTLLDMLKARGERHMGAEKLAIAMKRHWPEFYAGKTHSRRLKYAKTIVTRFVRQDPDSDEQTEIAVPLYESGGRKGYWFPPLPEARRIIAERTGEEMPDDGDWACWQPDQGRVINMHAGDTGAF